MIHSIYLMSVDWDQRATASRAVYEARRATGDSVTSQGAAFELVRRVYNNGDGFRPSAIGRAATEGTLTLARRKLEEAGSALTFAIDPTPEEVLGGPPKLTAVPDLEEDAGEKQPSVEAVTYPPEVYETAMMLIVAAGGNPFYALSAAGGLARTTGSDSFNDVQAAILKVFPADDDVSAALVARILDKSKPS